MKTVNIEKQRLFRFIVMGHKSLPEPSKHSRPYWGFVEMVTTKVEDIKTALKGEEYDKATRGHRRTSPARAFAEGIYHILRHKSGRKTHAHLVYKLEFPPGDETGEPRESMNVERESSFLIQVKNPNQKEAQFRGIQAKHRAVYPAHLQGQFGQLRYSAVDPLDFLNYEGCEFLLIAACLHLMASMRSLDWNLRLRRVKEGKNVLTLLRFLGRELLPGHCSVALGSEQSQQELTSVGG